MVQSNARIESQPWKKPDEALGMQKTQVDGYNSLVEERHLAMKYHGLDVEHSDVECKK